MGEYRVKIKECRAGYDYSEKCEKIKCVLAPYCRRLRKELEKHNLIK